MKDVYILNMKVIEKSLKNISKKDLDPKIFIENPEENQYKYYGG